MSWLLLTVPFVTTRTRLARTVSEHLSNVLCCAINSNRGSYQVVKLDTVSMTAPSSVTSLRISSVVSVAMLAIWLVIVPTAREAVTGVTPAAHVAIVLLALVMPWIARWR